MANRLWHSDAGNNKREVATIYAEFTGAGSSNPTGLAGRGVTSVVRNGTGDYTITFDDKYNSLAFFSLVIEDTSVRDYVYSVHSASVSAATPVIRFFFTDSSTGSATDIQTGDVCRIKVELKNTAVGD